MKFASMKDTLNLVFLGCGKASQMHSKTLAGFEQIQLYYASRDKNKAENFNRKFSGRGIFE